MGREVPGTSLSSCVACIEGGHEAVEQLLDRLAASRPEVDEQALVELEKVLVDGLEPAYRSLMLRSPSEVRWQLVATLRRLRGWLDRLRELRREKVASQSWWARLSDVEHRIRRHFHELETGLFDAESLDDDAPASSHDLH